MNLDLRDLGRVGSELFPLTFNLKVIMAVDGEDSGGRSILENILSELKIPNSGWETKISSGSKYVRYSVTVTLDDRDLMDRLYLELGRNDRIKAAI